MRSLRFLSLFLLPAALVAVGCSEPTASGPPEAINESVDDISQISDLPLAFGDRGNPVVRLTLGSTFVTEYSAVPGGREDFMGERKHAFVAYQRADDGTDASGWTRLKTENVIDPDNITGSRVRGRVVCMNPIAEGLIVLASETTHRSGTPPAGLPPLPLPASIEDEGTVWVVRDNGRGPRADPDEQTPTVVTTRAVSRAICQNPLAFFPIAFIEANLFPIEKGFIKVIER